MTDAWLLYHRLFFKLNDLTAEPMNITRMPTCHRFHIDSPQMPKRYLPWWMSSCGHCWKYLASCTYCEHHWNSNTCLFSSNWLENFAYRTQVSAAVFGGALTCYRSDYTYYLQLWNAEGCACQSDTCYGMRGDDACHSRTPRPIENGGIFGGWILIINIAPPASLVWSIQPNLLICRLFGA